MSTTTFKSVGGSSKPEKAPAQTKKAATPAKKTAPTKVAKAKKPGIIIKGEGTIRVFDNGAMRRVPRGETVDVSAEELAYLKRRNIDFA